MCVVVSSVNPLLSGEHTIISKLQIANWSPYYSIDRFANRQVAKNDMKLLFFVLVSGRIAEFGIYGVGRPVWGREVKAGTYGNAVCLLIRV